MSVKHLVTAEDLWRMPEIPGKNVELIDGEMVAVSPAGMGHGLITGNLYEAMKGHVRRNALGIVVGDNVGYVLRRDPDEVRAPDVSFIALERVPKTGLLETRFWEGPPTLAVEVVSPDDRMSDVDAKVQHYLEAGTRQVWVLWPSQRSVTVYDPDGSARKLGPDAYLDGGDVLPGFNVLVGELFDVDLPR